MADELSVLPTELQGRIFSCLPPDLQSLCVAGHILVTHSRTVSLPPGMMIKVFALGGGGLTVRFPLPVNIITVCSMPEAEAGGDTVVEAGQERLTARGGEGGGRDGGSGWSGGGGGGGRGGSNGGDGMAGDGVNMRRGGRGSGAELPPIPGLTLAPGRGGQPRGGYGGGGGGVLVDGRNPVRAEDTLAREGYGVGGGHYDGIAGIVVIYP